MVKKVLSFGSMVFLLVFLCLPMYSQSKETGVIEATVTSTEGEVLPGVEVNISSPSLIGGTQTHITSNRGKVRFVALPPGSYTAEAKLEGFKPQMVDNIKISVEKTLEINFVLEIGSLNESITVIGKAPIIDVKDSQTATTEMPIEFLEKVPGNRSLRQELNLAPAAYVGYRQGNVSMYGSTESLSNNFLIDGIKTNSPEAGEPEVDFSFNSIKQIKVMGLGAPAEYGGFSGAVLNAISKSGGNQISGLANVFLNPAAWHSENWGDYPELIRKEWDYKTEGFLSLSGALMKDKLWFYSAVNFTHDGIKIEDYTGPTEYANGYKFQEKLTWQIGVNDRLSQLIQYRPERVYDIDTGPLFSPEASWERPNWLLLWNTDFFHAFSNNTFLNAKYGGYSEWGHRTVEKTIPSHVDLETGYVSGNTDWFWDLQRVRHQMNVTISHHAEDFLAGSHDFKFGTEVEVSFVGNYYGYPGGKFYQDLGNEPYLMSTNYSANQIGFKSKGRTTRISTFVQDSWTIGRLTINPGLRVNSWRGDIIKYNETDSAYDDNPAFSPNIGIAPRIGLTFDVFGDHTTVLKAHYGKYYHGMLSTCYLHFKPQNTLNLYKWVDNDWQLLFSDPWESKYTVDPDLKMPYMGQFILGAERQLTKDISVGVTYIHRDNYDLMSRVNLTGRWEPMQWAAPTGTTLTVYRRLNPGENKFLITNPKAGEDYGAAWPDIVWGTPTRKYRGLQFEFTKRYSNRWMMSASYILGKSEGTDDNSWGEFGENRSSMLGSDVSFSNPNWAINNYGTLTLSPTHIFKISAAWDIPVINVTFGAHYNLISGNNYSRELLLPDSIDPDPAANYQSNIWIYEEKRGGYVQLTQSMLDLRMEKYFQFGNFRVAALADIFNVLNSDTPISLEHHDDPRSNYPFEYVWGIHPPRTFRLGFKVEF